VIIIDTLTINIQTINLATRETLTITEGGFDQKSLTTCLKHKGTHLYYSILLQLFYKTFISHDNAFSNGLGDVLG